VYSILVITVNNMPLLVGCQFILSDTQHMVDRRGVKSNNVGKIQVRITLKVNLTCPKTIAALKQLSPYAF
jgi:hypothetical protein